ncbi:MAG: hypothetical protein OXH65_02215 [Paracoccaceae bacterium]|nr:hypothetical protein [Paracoccaceae bacterium]MCY4100391.1 hypothetical protein [Paracoccaceae bacterium]MDE2673903.1 hypothetical protein [Paracoccaceae bacterium]MXZ49859.1 hypothetical protein [Paracoccaceae bacterium]MYF45003.1 hypothetical protein [Paracoccaceae bacterium]
MKKLVLAVAFAGLAFGANAGGLDDADTSDEMAADPEMMEPEVEEPSEGGGGFNMLTLLLVALLAVAFK